MSYVIETIEMIGLVNYLLTWVTAVTWILCYAVVKDLYNIGKEGGG